MEVLAEHHQRYVETMAALGVTFRAGVHRISVVVCTGPGGSIGGGRLGGCWPGSPSWSARGARLVVVMRAPILLSLPGARDPRDQRGGEGAGGYARAFPAGPVLASRTGDRRASRFWVVGGRWSVSESEGCGTPRGGAVCPGRRVPKPVPQVGCGAGVPRRFRGRFGDGAL
jgi:hypothetical protein